MYDEKSVVIIEVTFKMHLWTQCILKCKMGVFIVSLARWTKDGDQYILF